MSFLYPRTITITRAAYKTDSDEGLHQGEAKVLGPVPANIQLKRDRAAQPISYPAPTNSTVATPTWVIFFQGPNGAVEKGDKILDDLGRSYEVDAPYWNSLGYAVEARGFTP